MYESATEVLGKCELTLLRVEVDALEAERKHGAFTTGKRRKRSREETLEAVRLLSEQGLVPQAIADKLGVTDMVVRRHLKDLRDLKKTA